MVANEPSAKVALLGDEGQIETLWAFDLGHGHYRLDNTPWYAFGISWQDVVEAHPDEAGQLHFVKVVSKSGNRTIRVMSEVEFTDEWLKRLLSLGVTYEGANRRYFGINIPPDVDLDAISSFLVQEGVTWEYADPTYEEVRGRGRAT